MASIAKKSLRALLIAAFWLGVWAAAAAWVGSDLLFPPPGRVLRRLGALAVTSEFWGILASSLLRITLGFALGILLGTVVGILTAKLPFSGPLLTPLLTVMKATPVASFIILALVWMKKELIPVFISFLMVFPVMQSNVHTGVRSTDPALLEMARVYRVSPGRRVRALYLPAVLPYFSAGCRTCLGLAWKAGVAAEVICVPMQSIGRQLYFSKMYLETVDVFAWTVVVVVVSLLIEKLLSSALNTLRKGGRKP